jgi:Helix-turn-helix domain
MSGRQASTEVGPPESEYLTVPEIAKILRRNRKTVYGWIESGGIGEVDGLFVVQGRYLIHWPTFRTRQFKTRVYTAGILGGIAKWHGWKRTDTAA